MKQSGPKTNQNQSQKAKETVEENNNNFPTQNEVTPYKVNRTSCELSNVPTISKSGSSDRKENLQKTPKVPPLKIKLNCIFKRKRQKQIRKEKKRMKELLAKVADKGVKAFQARNHSVPLDPLDFVSCELPFPDKSQKNPVSSVSKDDSSLIIDMIPPEKVKLEKVIDSSSKDPPMVSIPTDVLNEYFDIDKRLSPKKNLELPLAEKDHTLKVTSQEKNITLSSTGNDHTLNVTSQEKNTMPLVENDLTLLDAYATRNKLRPWLLTSSDARPRKFSGVCDQMLKPKCLSALFKCMGVDCGFYTNESQLFQKHLQLHLQHQRTDFQNFSSCCYCNFSHAKNLVEHIVSEHGCNCSQCSYCFYRSSSDIKVQNHLQVFHPEKKAILLKVQQFSEKNSSLEIAMVRKDFKKNVPRMCCICKFYFRLL